MMKRLIAFGFVAVLVISAPGCGPSADTLTQQWLSDMDALSEALEKKEPPEKLKAATEKLKASSDALSKKKVNNSEGHDVAEKFGSQITAARTRLAKAAAENPDGAKTDGLPELIALLGIKLAAFKIKLTAP